MSKSRFSKDIFSLLDFKKWVRVKQEEEEKEEKKKKPFPNEKQKNPHKILQKSDFVLTDRKKNNTKVQTHFFLYKSCDQDTSPSEAGVIVRGRGHLEDALCVLLQQGAPADFASQQQVFTVQRVDELHLWARASEHTHTIVFTPS